MSETLSFRGAEDNALIADEIRPSEEPVHGAPVLLLHGGGQTRYAWGGAAGRLAANGHRAFTVDQRGHGESAWVPSGAYAFDDFALDAIALAQQITARCGRPPVLVGASLGGIAGLLAVRHAGNAVLAGLVLVDITPHMDPDGIGRVQGFMAERLEEGFATLEEAADAIAAYLPNRKRPRSLAGLAKNLRRDPDGRYRWHWDPSFLKGPRPISTGDAAIQEDLVQAAQQLDMPVLLVRGQQSELVSEAAVDAFRALVPSMRYVDVSGAGHMVAGDRNDVFTDAIAGFLDSLAAA
ncbi:alpha/beta hydrolase [Pseudohoeflea sp. DP4N28-3]|uniref:Alpha/beta hydrolase n=1 Tax=Pseudohoeflea coraliihabitans TaxID=2860393 RepID=A0ABS6WS13_9HYPH|nr:alpha/beta hydrolase [Pseudohoeflea sp. DP4N28-3]